MDQFVPYPMIPPAPAEEHRKTTPGVEYNVLRPEQKTGLAQHDALAQQEMDDVTGPARQLRDQKAAIDADIAEQQRVADEANRKEKEIVDQKTAADLAVWKNRLEGAYKSGQSTPAPALFADRTTGKKVMLGLGLALTGLGDAIRNAGAARMGQVGNAHSFLDLVEMDLNRQREHIAKQKDEILTARTGVQDAATARQVALAEVDSKGAGIYKRLGTIVKTNLLSKLNNTALAGDVEQNPLLRAVEEKRLASQDRSLSTLYERHATPTTEHISRVTAPTTAAGGGVEADKNAANFGLLKTHSDWIADAMPNLSPQDIKDIVRAKSLAAAGQQWPAADAVAKNVFGVDSQSGLSSKAKEFIDHASRGSDAMGRLKSGGAVNDKEEQRFNSYLEPSLTDGPKDLQMRSRNIKGDTAIFESYVARNPRNMVAAPVGAGPTAPLVPTQPGASQAIPPATPGPVAKQSPREQAIRLLRENPRRAGAAAIKQTYNITDQDLR